MINSVLEGQWRCNIVCLCMDVGGTSGANPSEQPHRLSLVTDSEQLATFPQTEIMDVHSLAKFTAATDPRDKEDGSETHKFLQVVNWFSYLLNI